MADLGSERSCRLAGVLAFLFWMIPATGALAGARVIDQIAAVVGTEIILLSEVHARATPAFDELEKAASQGGAMMMVERRKQQIVKESLQAIIDETLVRQQARDMKITVTTEEVEMAINNMAKENGIDLDTFERALKARGKDMVTYRSEMRRNLLGLKVLNLRVRGRVKISEDEARQYYNNQVRDVRATGTFEGAHILIRVSSRARAVEVAKSRKKAEELRSRLDEGEDFKGIAKEMSQDETTAPNGGSLGVRNPGEIPPVLDRVFLDLEPGEIAGPIRTSAGFHILRLNKRENLGVQPFAEVRHRIVNQLSQEEMVRQQKIWLKELRLRTFIDVRL